MVEPLSSKNLVKHIANGRLAELCLLCLIPLKDISSESVFTLICKEETEYCIADALEAVCQFELHRSENYNVCIDCFKAASEAYKFHLQAKRSMELITHYTQELFNNIKNIEITTEDMEKLLFVPLTEYIPTTILFDYSLEGIGRNSSKDGSVGNDNFSRISCLSENISEDVGSSVDQKTCDQIASKVDSYTMNDNDNGRNDNFDEIEADYIKNTEENILIVVEKETQLLEENVDSTYSMHSSDDEIVMIVNEKKVRKKRDPMIYMACSQCPIKYRFVSKLKDHMKTVHNIDLYYCKICKIITEHKEEYEEHLKSHTDKHQCTICNIVYKKADTLMAHMKLHEKGNQPEQSESANICEQCGVILEDEASLEEHMSSKHVKRYTCYYCGRMYRGEGSFESHIRKHEEYWDKKQRLKPDEASSTQGDTQASKQDRNTRSVCQTCGKDFVDERSLLWHQRLHSNDRPYTCEICGRGFVSKNRRNQHSLCAHTPPQRRCPLCPALFHLRSMVNTHVKKVHLKAHKRRNRSSKHQNVYWRTQAVPIQELSIDVQNDVLELKAAQDEISSSNVLDNVNAKPDQSLAYDKFHDFVRTPFTIDK